MQTSSTPTDASHIEAVLQSCLDALARGDCTEEEFLSETLDHRDSESNSAWDVLAYIDQRYRRGQLAEPIFHSIKSRIAQRVIGEGGALHDRHGVTIELFPIRPGRALDTEILLPAGASLPALATAPAAKFAPGARPPAAAPPAVAPSFALQRSSPPALSIGCVLRNRYVVKGLLGRGGMGDIYAAADCIGGLGAPSHARVAIKVTRETIEQRPELLARLQREFDCTRRLSHPNIVKVYEFEQADECAFYTMELLEGEHIGDLLMRENRGPLPAAYAWAVIGAVGAALAHAHARSVIHGDVSPKNIMITRAGEVRVLDFGSSTMSNGIAAPAELEVKGAVAATPAYASCEVLEGSQPDPRDDLYALACIAYELLAGEHPFHGKRSCEARDLGLRPRRPPGLKFTQWRTLQIGLALSREARSMSVRQWLARLGLEPEPECLPPLGAAARRPRMRFAALARGAALAMALVAASVVAWNSLHPDARGAQTVPQSSRQVGIPDIEPPAQMIVPAAASNPAAADTDHRVAGLDVAVNATTATPTDPVPASQAPVPASQAPMPASQAPVPAPAPRRASVQRPALQSVVRFSANHYLAAPGAHFVEARVRRTRGADDNRGFVWWTREDSARAGVDFVAQAPTPYAFAEGRQQASLFIRLLPNSGRAQNATFHVCLGKPGSGSGPTSIACSTILLPIPTDRAT